MKLLEQKKDLDEKLHFIMKEGEEKTTLAWIDDDGVLCLYGSKIETIAQSKAICQWYLNICDQL